MGSTRGGPWRIEGAKGRWACWSLVCRAGMQQARIRKKAVKVLYVGPRNPGEVIRAANRCNFMINGAGSRNHRVEPMWWENQAKKAGKKG